MRIAVSVIGYLFVLAAALPAYSVETPARKSYAVRSLQELSLDISPPRTVGPDGKELPLPASSAQKFFEQEALGVNRDFQPTTVHPLGDWNFRYQPLLFEEPNAERYGEVCSPLQPGISAARFYARTLFIPYYLVTPSTRRAEYFARPDRPGYGGVSESRFR